MHLKTQTYKKLCENLGFDESSNLEGFKKLEKSIFLLHNEYLLGSAKEAGIFIKNHGNIKNIFDLVINIYNKRIKTHHALFLIIHIFETALRSKMAFILSQNYSSNPDLKDDWFVNCSNLWLIKKVKRVIEINGLNEDFLKTANSFEVLDLFTLGDLENVIDNNWAIFQPIFAGEKQYKNQILPSFGTKNHLLSTFSRIRKERNNIFHNRPPKGKARSIITNIEILLLRLDFNLKDAFNGISNLEYGINLKYEY